MAEKRGSNPKSLTPFSCKLNQFGFGVIKIGDTVLPDTTSIKFTADMDSVAQVEIGMFPHAPIEIELPAQVTVNIIAADGEIIRTPLENGKISYKVIRQAPMFPPGT